MEQNVSRSDIKRKQWQRMQNGKDCAAKALREYFDNDEDCTGYSCYETGVLTDLLLGLLHLSDLKEMDFQSALRAALVEYNREKKLFAYEGQPACANLGEE